MTTQPRPETETEPLVLLWPRLLAWVLIGAGIMLALLGLEATTVDGRHVVAVLLALVGTELLRTPGAGR